MSGEEWTIIDTETTGLAAPIYTLEIAAQRMRGLEPIGQPFRVFLNHEVDIPWGAQQVHGYSRDFISRTGIDPRKAHRAFADYVEGTAISAYNLPYDYDKVLAPEWKRMGIPTASPRGFCMMRLTQKIFSPSPAGNYRLQSLREHFKLPERDAHSALGDVKTVVDLLRTALRPRLTELGLSNAATIARYLEGTGYADHLPFGKHKGRHWREAKTDPDMLGWLQWLARQDNPNSSKMAKWYLDQVRKDKADEN